MIDLHLHTKASHDGQGSVADYCEAAIAKGINVIAITDHLDLDPGLAHSSSYNHDVTLREVATARESFGSKLKILAGVEVTYQSEHEKTIIEALEKIDADIVIAGVHMIGGAEFVISEEEGASNYFKDKLDARDAYMPYFEELLRAVKTGCFDVIAHIDGIKRYGQSMIEPIKSGDYYGVLRRIFEGMVKRDMALEVNTAGLYHPCREIYPSGEILQLYRELGGKRLTLGSDAHEPANVGRGFEFAEKLIRLHKFNDLTIFEKRAPRQVPL